MDRLEADYQAMTPLPPSDPPVGLNTRVRLARDYYVRVDSVDYSVDPRVIGRIVDVFASLTQVTVFCDGKPVARHERSWAKQGVVTDDAHVSAAKALRHNFNADRQRRAQARHHHDGHAVALRALPDYDALFGVDFTPPTTISLDEEASSQ